MHKKNNSKDILKLFMKELKTMHVIIVVDPVRKIQIIQIIEIQIRILSRIQRGLEIALRADLAVP